MSIVDLSLHDWSYVFHVKQRTVLVELTFTEVESEEDAVDTASHHRALEETLAGTPNRIKVPTSSTVSEEKSKVRP